MGQSCRVDGTFTCGSYQNLSIIPGGLGPRWAESPNTRMPAQDGHQRPIPTSFVHIHVFEITVQRPKRVLGVFSHLPFFFLFFHLSKVRAGEFTERITTDDSEGRVSTKLWSLFLTQHFQLQNTGQIQGYCCHIYLGGDNHERKGIRVPQRYSTYIIDFTTHLLNSDLLRPISSLTK